MPPVRPWEPEDTARIAWALAGLAALAGIGALIVAKFRGVTEESDNDASESLTKFRELHSRGELTDEEFRTIKAKLTETLRQQLRDTEEPG